MHLLSPPSGHHNTRSTHSGQLWAATDSLLIATLQIIVHTAPQHPGPLHELVECSAPGCGGRMLTPASGLITLEASAVAAQPPVMSSACSYLPENANELSSRCVVTSYASA